jgi:hypothetical protein
MVWIGATSTLTFDYVNSVFNNQHASKCADLKDKGKVAHLLLRCGKIWCVCVCFKEVSVFLEVVNLMHKDNNRMEVPQVVYFADIS